MGKKGKKCKKNKTGAVKNTTLFDPMSDEFRAQLNSLLRGREERRRVGSSRYVHHRINDEAEILQTEAHKKKLAGNFQEAHELYTSAIELDKFNHYYFYQRAATCCKGKQWELAYMDFQFGLDLCSPQGDYKYDECYSMTLASLTLCCMELFQWEKANEWCEMGRNLIGHSEDTALALKVLKEYDLEIKHMLRTLPTDYSPLMIKTVVNEGNELKFMYSTKAASLRFEDAAPLQPEVLAVDLVDNMPVEEMWKCVIPDKIKAWQDSDTLEKDEGSSFQIPNTKYWATIIPVWSKGDRRVIQRCLMCDCMKDTKIVIVKLEESEEPPTVDTAAYVASIVKNAPSCEDMYDQGKKLVEE